MNNFSIHLKQIFTSIFLLFVTILFSQTGTEYANIQYLDNMENGSGSISIYIYVENEYDGHWDYLKDLDIDVSINGEAYQPFAFLGKQDGIYDVNSYASDYKNRETEFVLNTGGGNPNQHIRLYFNNEDHEVESKAVTFSHFEDTNSQVAGTPKGADRVHINVKPYEINRFKGAKTIQFRCRGNYLENWLDHENANNTLSINEKLTEKFELFEENNSGQEEINFNVDFNKSEGAAHLTFRIESIQNETEYDHLACLELKKIVYNQQNQVVSDEVIGYVNHNSNILGCSDLFSDAATSDTFLGEFGDSYKFGLKYDNLYATPYGNSYWTKSGGDNYFVIRDYITQENYKNKIQYYVHGTYYSRERNGENKKVNFNWADNIKGNFVVNEEIPIPNISLKEAEVSSTNNCQIDLSWDTPTLFGGDTSRNFVAIYRDDKRIAYVDADGGVNKYADTDIVAGEKYNYKIALEYDRAYNDRSFEAISGQKDGKEGVIINLLEAPSGLSSNQVGCNGNIEISWSYTSNPSSFVLERKASNDEDFTVLNNNISGSLRSFTDTDVIENEVYVYRIAAISNALSCNTTGYYSSDYTHSKDPIDIKPIFNNESYLVEASKGYYSNRTELEWIPNLDKEQYINQYKIYVREFGTTIKPNLLTTLDINAKKYEHTNGKAGTIYEYFIVGERVVETECGRQITSSYTIDGLSGIKTPDVLGEGVAYDIGLRVATGVINGNINYTGGTAVPNVKVIAERQEINKGKSLSFNGVNSYVDVTASASIDFKDEFTVSFWVKPENNEESYLLENSQFKILRLENGQIAFAVYGKNGEFTQIVTDWHVVPTGNWTQITVTYNSTKREIKAYYNGSKWGALDLNSDFTTLRPNLKTKLSIGRREGTSGYLQGKLDEIRMFDRCLEAEEIARISGSFVAADYNGLKLYLKVFEGRGNTVYDIAHKGDLFYKNNGVLNNTIFSDDIPSQSQLGNVGYTDAYGNYTIEAVEYGDSGENFNIIPTATLAGAIHEFDPVRKTLFIGEGSKVNNDKDFEDISSFQFSGYVRFNFPNTEAANEKTSGSEGIKIYLDGGGAIAGDDRQAYETDENGFFDVQIPIGQHYIEFRRNGHVFANGRFPATGVYDFQEGVTGLEILDDTKHKLTGRIVGGLIEGNKPMSMESNPSVNNIGQAKFTLTSEDGKIVREITSSSSTGEYSIELPPKKFISSSVKWTKDLIDIVSSGDIQPIDLSSINAYNGTKEADSVFVDDVYIRSDTTFYNVRKDFIYRKKPELVVTGLLKNGNSITETTIKNSAEEFYNLKQGNTAVAIDLKTLPYPTYFSASDYEYKMKAVEKYTNKDTSIEYSVPVTDGELVINNGIGVGFYKDEEGKSKTYGSPEVITLDSHGELVYQFKAQEPNINENSSAGLEHLSYTKEMSITLNVGAFSTSWPNASDSNETQRAYIIGGKQQGANFVTKAPPVVDFVLRDPPGSNSYAYWSKEESFFTSAEYNAGGFGNLNAFVGLGVGMNTLLGGGIVGVGEIAEGKILGTMEINAGFDIGAGGEYIFETSFSEDIQTNGDAIQVGRSDVFVAKSQNLMTGTGVHIRPVPESLCGGNCYGEVMKDKNGNNYRMTRVLQSYLNPVGSPTFFIFSQNHIQNVLIPDLIEVRNTFLTRPGSRYISKIPQSNENFGSNNDDPVWGVNASTTNYIRTEAGDFDGQSYTYSPMGDPNKAIDSIRVMNQQIRLWKEALANNEIQKWIAKKYQSSENVSIASGVSLERSNTSSHSGSAYVSFEMSSSVAYGAKLEFDGYGVAVESEMSAEVGIRSSAKSTTGGGTSKTVGYVLNDPDEDDAISVDIFSGTGSNGPIFLTKAGQTSCPFEDKIVMEYANEHYIQTLIDIQEGDKNKAMEEAKAYGIAGATENESQKYGEANQLNADINQLKVLLAEIRAGEVVLSNATLQRDKPAMKINGAKTAQAFNVPADEAANFKLTLLNEGEAGDPQYFSVKAMDETNPNGLEMTIDGQSINTDREFLVQGNGGIQKILKVNRGPNHYDYENVGVVIKSTCQADPTGNDAVLSDTIYFNVKYLPTCTPIEVNYPNNNWTINNSFNNKFPITIGGYDVNTVGFEEVKLQYKESSSSEWTLLSTYYRDAETRTTNGGAEDDFLLPTDGNSFTYYWQLGQVPDGNYDIRALSKCSLAEETTAIYSGVIDRKNPEAFGLPQPSDGILSAGEDASIQFTETINGNLLSIANFDVRGVLNAGKIRHDASVSFDGSVNTYVKAELVNLESKAFSIEFYAKKEALNVNQILVSQGSDSSTEMLVGINASNKFYFQLAGKTVTGSKTIDEKWHHYTVTYDPLKADVMLYVDAEMDAADNSFVVQNKLKEDLYFGKSTIGTGVPFSGQMHEVRIWSKSLSLGEINNSAVQRMVGNEAGLLYNWELEDVNGELALDKVRGKHAEMKANWKVSPVGYGLRLNGSANEASSQAVAIDNATDFTIEMWFKSDGGTNETLLSNGKGDGTDNNTSGWSIGINKEGKISAKNNASELVGSSVVTDNKWHHVAISVNTRGSAILFVDAQEEMSISSSLLNGFGGSKLAIGQRDWYDGANNLQDQYFSGSIDELRIWNTARKLEQISRDRFNNLSGTEPGLIEYYPFENYAENGFGITEVSSTLDNASVSLSKSTQNVVLGAGVLNQDTPTIKLKRPVEIVNISYVVNNDKIIITLNIEESKIENVQLDFTISNVKDLNGNEIASPITWSAYVDKNQVVWQNSQFNLETENGEELNFETKIFNNSGESKTYEITNIPSWLEVSPMSGTVGPLTTVPVSFKVSGETNNGKYQEDVLLTTDFGFAEKLNVNVSVKQAPPSDWKIDPTDFEYSMNVVGQIAFDGILSRDEGNILAAFVDGECRGLVNLRHLSNFDNYQAFLTIYSNIALGENLEFKVWEASSGIVHSGITHNLSSNTFIGDAFEGSSANPKLFRTTNIIAGAIEVPKGWKWISFSLEGADLNTSNGLLENVNPLNLDIIKTRINKSDGNGGFSQLAIFDKYSSTGETWYGSITNNGAYDTGVLYKIKLSNEGVIRYEGRPVNPINHELNLVDGWNYIGYIGSQKIALNEGLSNYNATDGDLIKNQYYSAIYDSSYGWIGSLTVLSPDEGYMLKSAIGQTFKYPAFNSSTGSKSSGKSTKNSFVSPWELKANQYAENMTIIARVNEAESKKGILGAFVNGECRGVAKAIYNPILEEQVFVLNISGLLDSQVVSFKYNADNEFYQIEEIIEYKENEVKGRLDTPKELTIRSSEVDQNTLDVYPNPFSDKLNIRIKLEENTDLVMKLFNNINQLVKQESLVDLKKGTQTITLNGNGLASGVYYLVLKIKDQVLVEKIILTNE
ncbi:T9SS type A sorting domain-containing protein [Flavicella sediminum]|uniref:T9SS type A sorting domain-containing protein n=1 Tax=Flavicella sediminum TaxID=2585141 RepID=UPI00111ED289|nr:LamG-like jellyroll fold domain-containing protein [Flavicella sediminum]